MENIISIGEKMKYKIKEEVAVKDLKSGDNIILEKGDVIIPLSEYKSMYMDDDFEDEEDDFDDMMMDDEDFEDEDEDDDYDDVMMKNRMMKNRMMKNRRMSRKNRMMRPKRMMRRENEIIINRKPIEECADIVESLQSLTDYMTETTLIEEIGRYLPNEVTIGLIEEIKENFSKKTKL